MAISQKYGRTGHYPFSPGTTSDDRIQHDYWELIQKIPRLVHTEKLDGENNCLSKYGVFARSHAAPTTSPWTETLRQYWHSIRPQLGDLEVFLENLYAVHSLRYRKLDHHFHVFAIRDHDRWLSWEETKFYAGLLDLPTVPEIDTVTVPANRAAFEADVLTVVAGSGAYDPVNAHDGSMATMEGIVTRNAEWYGTDQFAQNVFKYVRKGHVKTDQHWTRHWQRARLKHEGGDDVDHQ
ncbi:RNA ligase family protein [Paraflavitalea sp. CAU 1676]|uniref:RNA ligase family protein n=1 Tax=Paraflavitalea sp. CAU 1676 TaxID=3032598 RepID=UPI0023DCB0FF|nr:RNA ligase family protein [Paraflavitalea sp. CAU 1676]MDF2192675.1 RNA ligase family protein [Paraflavitalea sp. CAU 1676]